MSKHILRTLESVTLSLRRATIREARHGLNKIGRSRTGSKDLQGSRLLQLPMDILVKIFAELPGNMHRAYVTVCSRVSAAIAIIGFRGEIWMDPSAIRDLAKMAKIKLSEGCRSALPQPCDMLILQGGHFLQDYCLAFTEGAAGSKAVIAPRGLQLNHTEWTQPCLRFIDCSRLRRLAFEFPRITWVKQDIVDIIMASAPTLQDLSVKSYDDTDAAVGTLQEGMFLPCLESVDIAWCHCVKEDGLLYAITSNAPLLTRLIVHGADSSKALLRLLYACGKQLQTLHFAFSRLPLHVIEWPDAERREIISLLPSLKMLDVDW